MDSGLLKTSYFWFIILLASLAQVAQSILAVAHCGSVTDVRVSYDRRHEELPRVAKVLSPLANRFHLSH